MSEEAKYKAIDWKSGKLILLDQRKLPQTVEYMSFVDAKSVAQAIRDMVVRGAPAIGITAAYAVVLSALEHGKAKDGQKRILDDMTTLEASRPTAVNLAWAVQRMRAKLLDINIDQDPATELLACAEKIHAEDIEANLKMSRYGASLIEGPVKHVITHCNTGPLATGGIGTALGVISQAYREQRINGVYADETRPWLQGARLTSWELMQQGLPVHLICDSAAAYVMKQGNVSWAIVGADRITANGDAVNKIGTYGLAILAKHHNIKFMVVAPCSTIDLNTATGAEVKIEFRPGDEVTRIAGKDIAPALVSAMNPAFDVTPAQLIDAIVTEVGVVRQPNAEKMAALLSEK